MQRALEEIDDVRPSTGSIFVRAFLGQVRAAPAEEMCKVLRDQAVGKRQAERQASGAAGLP